MTGQMRLRNLEVATFDHATLATLEDEVNAFLAAEGERVLVDIQWDFDGTNYVCFITYAKE